MDNLQNLENDSIGLRINLGSHRGKDFAESENDEQSSQIASLERRNNS